MFHGDLLVALVEAIVFWRIIACLFLIRGVNIPLLKIGDKSMALNNVMMYVSNMTKSFPLRAHA